MSKISGAIHEIHHMDTLSSRDQWVNQIHPLVKFVLTLVYISAVVSFHKYDVAGVAGMAVYPAAVFILADLSFLDSLKRLRLVLPLVCFVGILNPFLDNNVILFQGIPVSAGILSMATLVMKGIFSVLASYLLIATTSVEKLCYAFCLLHIPRAAVTQFLLTYRYITVLLGEVDRITQAYMLRAPQQKGIHFKAWGSLAGLLLLRSMDRANEVYESMLLRGFQGDYQYMRERISFRFWDILYFVFWAAVFILFRLYPIVLLAGAVFQR
ncbi:MAG: cobalt ECF transporter T component CbiQ [Ruminococcus sp.]|nr:cobalt ECF transporter T component CbiQ [Ruminococcus sp.]